MIMVKIIGTRYHGKASEKYVDVVFCYECAHDYPTSVPIEYRRTGTEIPDNEVEDYLLKVHDDVCPSRWPQWRLEQVAFWNEKPGAAITKGFFDVLAGAFQWCCVSCTLPKNPNWARRVQDLKEFGYTLATNTGKYCPHCKKNTTQLILLPLKRGGITGYETWSPALRTRIIQLLQSFDSYEGKIGKKEGLLPDHKFPEIRWDSSTRRECLEDLSDEQIRNDFQLMSNQRNQQKREICRNCFQSGQRGIIFGVPFFYRGNDRWSPAIPKTGKESEAGCNGCGWYDIDTWRKKLIERTKS
jgi:hypothetical protein